MSNIKRQRFVERILEEEQFAFSGKMPESNSFQLGF